MGQPNSKSNQTSTSTKNSHAIKTKPCTDLIMARANNRLRLHAINMNFLLDVGVAPPLTVLIFEYANFYNMLRYDLLVSSALATSLGLFKLNPDQQYLAECKQAEAIARNHVWTADPLDVLEAEVKKNLTLVLLPIEITMKLDGVDLTFVGSPLQLAIMFLDQSRHAAKYCTLQWTDQGQAEMLMELIKKHMHHRIFEAEEQARDAAPFDPEEASRKAERSTILNAALEQIKANNFDAAAKIIRDYIISTKPEKITDNRFFSGVLRMILEAFDLLTLRAKDLKGGLYGKQADQYCFLIGIVQRFLPFKLRKELETGIYYGKNIDRTLDVRDAFYYVKNNGELGRSFYFCATGRAACAPLGGSWVGSLENDVAAFKTVISNYISAAELWAIEHSTGERHHDFVERNRKQKQGHA